ncbi:MAG: glycosyltransferase family 4 protein [Patescibacteria group bacterium]|nr:glycosyltransferase family 4 protein [Patescibacteria group bacterium]
MKRVLFIGVTNYNLVDSKFQFHLRKKFGRLSQEIIPYVLAKGKPFHKKIWETEFYLLSPKFFWPLSFPLVFYLCFIKKIDTIICQSPLIEGFLGSILKKILKKELIVEIHGDWEEGPFLARKRRLEFLERKIVPVMAKFSLKSADKIRAISNFTKRKAFKISGPKPYFIFPTFTDIDLFLEEKETKFDNFILFVGALEKVKGVEYLIDAFSKIEKEFPDFKLVIVGDGSERKNLELLTSNLKLQNKVEFKGRLSLKETKEIMKNCYCLVLPSLSEGLPRVLMEAMALGKPVIGSNIGGTPDLIKDSQNGFLFEPKNVEQLAEKIKILLENKELAIEMGKKGREFVKKNFSNEKYIKNYISMINA